MAEQMSAQSALDALLDPSNKLENTFVIPEGTATVDALPIISEGTGIPLEELQAAAAEPPANYGLPAEATALEGFLFPATYTLDPDIDAHAGAADARRPSVRSARRCGRGAGRSMEDDRARRARPA